jgi:hypothetical protein
VKKSIALAITAVCMFTGVQMGFAGEKAPAQMVAFAESKLAPLGSDPIIVKAVKQENAKGKTLAQIQEMDTKWKATPGIADYMQAMMDSVCGRHIRELQKSQSYYSEIFVMDNQGANVAMTDKTSDYWQGDEAKFQKSFNGGKGAVFVDDVEFDDSSQEYLVQVSVPVLDNGNVIGAITFGIDIDKIE